MYVQLCDIATVQGVNDGMCTAVSTTYCTTVYTCARSDETNKINVTVNQQTIKKGKDK